MALVDSNIGGEIQMGEPGAINLVNDPMHPLWEAAADMETVVFKESGYVENKEELAEEYAPYLSASEFVIANTMSGRFGGSLRIIHHEPGVGFKTLHDIKKGRLTVDVKGREIIDNLDEKEVIEVGTIGVPSEFRGRPEKADSMSVPLYGATLDATKRHGARYILASFDEDYFSRFKGIFGPSAEALGPPTDYMGSPTVPAIIDVPRLMDYIATVWPDLHEGVVEAADKIRHT